MAKSGVVGAYACQPEPLDERRRFVEAVLALPGCDGLEIPFGSSVYKQDEPWIWQAMRPGGRHVLTLVVAAMEQLARDQAWGPASSEAKGRREFLALLARAKDAVAAAPAFGQRIVAVELQTAPRGDAAPAPSSGALLETLATAASWDWHGATLAIEHCDAYRPNEPYSKGFLSLDGEIEVAQKVSAHSATKVGICINWGRSVIEHRNPAGADRQIAQARAAGVLTGLMMSGACGVSGPFGAAWSDTHAPLAGDPEWGEPTSLMTRAAVGSALAKAGDSLRYNGVKVGARPANLSFERRLDHIKVLLETMTEREPVGATQFEQG